MAITEDFSQAGDEWPEGETVLIPQIVCTVWLKPFDLGVSQRLTISLPLDGETQRYTAVIQLTRLSGTGESWTRLNRDFVRKIRRHFLHWRAVREEDRSELYRIARDKLEQVAEPVEA